jgi:hypothetical protein
LFCNFFGESLTSGRAGQGEKRICGEKSKKKSQIGEVQKEERHLSKRKSTCTQKRVPGSGVEKKNKMVGDGRLKQEIKKGLSKQSKEKTKKGEKLKGN